jgi:hypothetical protein
VQECAEYADLMHVLVTADGDHVNSKDGRGSTWDYCSGDCLTSHLECSPVTTKCSNSKICSHHPATA